jgi:hypothetical protein
LGERINQQEQQKMSSTDGTIGQSTMTTKRGLAQMLKGGVIMDVINVEQAKIAEEAGAVAVMALERIPADIRADGGVSRMSDPDLIDAIKAAVSIPVSSKVEELRISLRFGYDIREYSFLWNLIYCLGLPLVGDGQGPHWTFRRGTNSPELGD